MAWAIRDLKAGAMPNAAVPGCRLPLAGALPLLEYDPVLFTTDT